MVGGKAETTATQEKITGLIEEYRERLTQNNIKELMKEARPEILYKTLCSFIFENRLIANEIRKITENLNKNTDHLNCNDFNLIDQLVRQNENESELQTEIILEDELYHTICLLEDTDEIKTLLEKLLPSFNLAFRALSSQRDELQKRQGLHPADEDLSEACYLLNEIQENIEQYINIQKTNYGSFLPNFQFRYNCLHILQNNEEARAVFASPRGEWSLLRLLDNLIATLSYCTGIPLSRPKFYGFFETTTTNTVDDVVDSLNMTR